MQRLADALTAAAAMLGANCLGTNPITAVLRIDSMEQRLDTMLRAIDTVQQALHEFYESLRSEQKERFKLLAAGAG